MNDLTAGTWVQGPAVPFFPSRSTRFEDMTSDDDAHEGYQQTEPAVRQDADLPTGMVANPVRTRI